MTPTRDEIRNLMEDAELLSCPRVTEALAALRDPWAMLEMFGAGLDTAEIAELTVQSEARVYNELARARGETVAA